MAHDNLTDTEARIVERILPADATTIAYQLGVSASTVYDHIRNIRAKGVDIAQNSEKQYIAPRGPPSVGTTSGQTRSETTQTTSKARDFITRLERELVARLEEQEPYEPEPMLQTEGKEDVVLHCTDDHMGQVHVNEFGEETYNSEIATERIGERFTHLMNEVQKRRAMGTEFETVHLLLGGDMVTNEAIYDGQAHEIDLNLEQQVAASARQYIDIIKKLADEFDSVNVVCQVGNHGEMRVDGSSKQANADGLLYLNLQTALMEAQLRNVRFTRSATTGFVNFVMRGHRAHLRHGQSALEHIGTSAGKKRWLAWKGEHGFDVGYRGHYHSFKYEPIQGTPVIMGGTIMPGGEHAESIGEGGDPVSIVHGVTDEQPFAWMDVNRYGGE